MARPEIKPEQRKTGSSVRFNESQREILACVDPKLQKSLDLLIELYHENFDIFDNLMEIKKLEKDKV